MMKRYRRVTSLIIGLVLLMLLVIAPMMTFAGNPPVGGFDYVNEWITNLENNSYYLVNDEQELRSSSTGYISIREAWFDTDITIEQTDSTYTTGTIDTNGNATLPIPARPDAPTGLGKTDETIDGPNNGIITSVNDTMEYKPSTGSWTAVATGATSITGLAPGTYEVRYKAIEGVSFASFSETLTIGAYSSPAATVPGVPTNVTAVAGNGQATISFTAPSNDGGDTIREYVVTSIPEGLMNTGSASPITVTGLTNGTAYTFTVIAVNRVGPGAASVASNAVTPAAPTYKLTVVNGVIVGSTTTSSGYYEAGTRVQILANLPPAGKVFEAWNSSDDISFARSTCMLTQINMPRYDAEVEATYIDDTLTKKHFGTWTGKGSVSSLIDMDIEYFKELSKNGKTVDPSNYVPSDGSTIITLNEAYLKTLSDGTHNFLAYFYNEVDNTDYYANLMLLVNKGSNDSDVVTVVPIKSGVKTGDNTNLIGWIVALALSASGIVLVPLTKKPRSQ